MFTISTNIGVEEYLADTLIKARSSRKDGHLASRDARALYYGKIDPPTAAVNNAFRSL